GRQLNRGRFPKLIRAETSGANAFNIQLPRLFSRPERAEELDCSIGDPIEILVHKVQIGKPAVPGGIGKGEFLHPPVVHRPAIFCKGKNQAGFAGRGLLIALPCFAQHPAAALEFTERDGQAAVAAGGRPRFGSPLWIVRIGGVADGEFTRIGPTAVRRLGKKPQTESFASAWESANLPAMHHFAGKTERVCTPARIVNISPIVEDAKSGQRGPPVWRAAAIHGDYDQVCASVAAKTEAASARREEAIPDERGGDRRE